MQREKLDLTEDDGYEALRGHIVEKALGARAKYGPQIDVEAMRKLLQDSDFVRYSTDLVLSSEGLQEGEFGHAAPAPVDGERRYRLSIHPFFEEQPEALPFLAAYHIVTINYADVATHKEAELFGAALHGLEVDDYYARLCQWADALAARA